MLQRKVYPYVGAMAAFMCSIATVVLVAAVWMNWWKLVGTSVVIYASALVVIPFALWHRIEDFRRKWKARICNVLTFSTALFTFLINVPIIREMLRLSPYIGWLNVALLAVSVLCMAYMAWALWDGGSARLGFGAMLLAGLTLIQGGQLIIAEAMRILWFLWLSYWFLCPLRPAPR